MGKRFIRICVGLTALAVSGCTLEMPQKYNACPSHSVEKFAELSYIVTADEKRCDRKDCVDADNCCPEFSSEQQSLAVTAFKFHVCPDASDFKLCAKDSDGLYYCNSSVSTTISCQSNSDCNNQNGILLGVCVEEECLAQQCLENYHLEGTLCVVDTVEHCGARENACGDGQKCVMGKCELTCSTGMTVCGNTCFDFRQKHVVSCSEDGKLVCEDKYRNCNRNMEDGCETLLNDNELHIAMCNEETGAIFCVDNYLDCDGEPNNGCEIEVHGRETHIAGCRDDGEGIICEPDFADCDKELANGCETPLHTNELHIAACGENGTLICETGYTDCDGNSINGCEKATESQKIEICDGRNIVQCMESWGNCDNNYETGCETNIFTDNFNCGECGNECPKDQSCTRGVCDIKCDEETEVVCHGSCLSKTLNVDYCADGEVVCNDGWADCDGDVSNGCETNLKTNNEHCGRCNNECNNGHLCEDGACSTNCPANTVLCHDFCYPTAMHVKECNDGELVCIAGYQNCSGNPFDGCEVDTSTNSNSCGQCDKKCDSGKSCIGGECKITCLSGQKSCGGQCLPLASLHMQDCTESGQATCMTGFLDCDLEVKNGCEIDMNAMHVASCVGKKLTCSSEFGDCDGLPQNGCETNLSTDNRNCGACGKICKGGTICSNGDCSSNCGTGTTACQSYCLPFDIMHIRSCPESGGLDCQPGYGNCDSNVSNGCEEKLFNNDAHCGKCGNACNTDELIFCDYDTCKFNNFCGSLATCDIHGEKQCIDINTDVNHCGSCGFSCPAGQACYDGNCLQKCVLDTSCPSGRCVDGVCLSCTTYSLTSNNTNELCYNDVDVSGFTGSTLTFPRAIYIGTLTMNRNSKVTQINMPSLRSAGSIRITDNRSLTSIVFDKLESDRFTISGNPSLTTIDMHSLVKIGSTSFSTISDNDALTSLVLTSLSSIGLFEISNNDALTSLEFPSLTTVYQSLRIWSNKALKTLRFPIVNYVFAITIRDNSSLSSTCAPTDYYQVGSGITFTNNYSNSFMDCH